MLNISVLKNLGHSYGISHIFYSKKDENIRQKAFETVAESLQKNPKQISENDTLLKDIWEGLFYCIFHIK